MQEIKREGKTKVVQDPTTAERVILPIGEDDPQLGIPYGLPWEDICQHPAMPDALRRAGIYTYDDLKAKPNEVAGVIAAVYGQDYHLLLIAARQFGGK